MNYPIQYKKSQSDQQGFVAIIVTVTLMLVMTLIVLAMSQNSNREQRQSLDRQLSDQAFYNAESGINDISSYLYANPGSDIDNEGDCTVAGLDPNIDGPDGVNKYSCITYNKAPKTLVYDELSVSAPKVFPVRGADSAGNPVAIGSLTISWDDSTDRDVIINDAQCNASTLSTTCSYGGVRLQLIRSLTSRDLIRNSAFIAYLLPSTSGDTEIIAGPKQGELKAVNCSSAINNRRCSITVRGLNENNLYATIQSLYRPTNVTISATDSAGTKLRLKDAQIMIDSTGKANDILRRIRVTVPASAQYDHPGFGLQSKESLCKLLVVKEGQVRNEDPAECPID